MPGTSRDDSRVLHVPPVPPDEVHPEHLGALKGQTQGGKGSCPTSGASARNREKDKMFFPTTSWGWIKFIAGMTWDVLTKPTPKYEAPRDGRHG